MNSKAKLKDQLIKQHANLLYTYKSAEKQVEIFKFEDKLLKVSITVLSAITLSPQLVRVFKNTEVWNYVSIIAGFILLCLSIYSLNGDHSVKALKMENKTNKLWGLKEEYQSLLTDFDILSETEIRKMRSQLTKELKSVYKIYDKSGRLAYNLARWELKKGKQTFKEGEADQLL